jgi:hypothetical protein
MKDAKGVQTGEIMDVEDSKQYNSPEVLASVTDRLTKLGGNPPPVVKAVPEVNEEVDDDDVTSTTQDVQDDNLEVNNDTDGNEDNDVKDGDDIKDGEEEAPVMLDKLYRAAVHNKWTPEQIVDFWKRDPELAKKTLEKMHEDMVNTSNVYAEHGRAKIQLEAQRAELQTPVVPDRPKDFVDIKKAEEEFGEGAAVIIKQLNDKLVDVVAQQQKQVQAPNTVQQNHVADPVARTEQNLAVVQQMGHWFADPGLEPYKEFYGDAVDSNGLMLLTRDHLTPTQRQNRDKLLNAAGDIEAGVALRAGTISVADALTRAHVILTQDMQTEVIRKGIMKQAKKRSKGVTLRPSGSTIKPQEKLKPGEKISEKQVNITASRRLKQLTAGKQMT